MTLASGVQTAKMGKEVKLLPCSVFFIPCSKVRDQSHCHCNHTPLQKAPLLQCQEARNYFNIFFKKVLNGNTTKSWYSTETEGFAGNTDWEEQNTWLVKKKETKLYTIVAKG